MTAINEPAHGAEFIISEANNFRSRDEVTLQPGTSDLAAGTLLGIITANGRYAPYDPANTDGTETVAGILIFPAEGQAGGTDTIPASVLTRDAEVTDAELTYHDSASAGEITTANGELADLGIIVRNIP